MKRKELQADERIENTISDSTSENSNDQKRLYELICRKKKFTSKKAKLILTTENDERSEGALERPQFFVQDLQRVVLFSLIGDQFRFYPRWCRIMRPKFIKSVQFVTINNFSEFDYQSNKKLFRKFDKIFVQNYYKKLPSEQTINSSSSSSSSSDPLKKTSIDNEISSIDFVSATANGNNFFNEFMSVPITRTQWLKIRDEDEFKLKRADVVRQYRSLYNRMRSSRSQNGLTHHTSTSTSALDKIPRTSLLLNLNQMLREDYPIPFDTSKRHNLVDYVYSKPSDKNGAGNYAPVTDTSPLFSIDCEMCVNIDGELEVVWLAIVDESLECIYETLLKPQKPIKNYLTFITGIREETLTQATVTLDDVYRKIDEILPPDGILCGQSLNNDLHALKMYHPYVIDTGIVYNLSGNRDIKPSLKRLSAQFLGKLIQESTHNPVVDARASLQLVLLKLRNALEFGDVIMNGCTNIYDETHLKESFESNMFGLDLSDPHSISRFIYQTGLNIEQNFFNVLKTNDVKCMYIDHGRYESNRSPVVKGETIEAKFARDNNETRSIHLASLETNELSKPMKQSSQLTWSQHYFDMNDESEESDESKRSLRDQVNENELKQLLKFLRDVYEKMSDDSLMMVAFTGRSKKFNLMQLAEREKNVSAQCLDENDSDNEKQTTDLNLNDLYKGRCFLKLKSTEMDKLEKEVKELYTRVNKLNGTKTFYFKQEKE